jgi:hypothetical protein
MNPQQFCFSYNKKVYELVSYVIWNNDREIWGSHGGEDVHVGLLGCDTVWTGR